MTFEVKLKTGFFKTQCYYLTVDHGQIFLTPHDADDEKFIVNNNELISMYIFEKSSQTGGIEIITQNRVYTLSFAIQSNLDDVRRAFAKEFGSKLFFQ